MGRKYRGKCEQGAVVEIDGEKYIQHNDNFSGPPLTDEQLVTIIWLAGPPKCNDNVIAPTYTERCDALYAKHFGNGFLTTLPQYRQLLKFIHEQVRLHNTAGNTGV